MSQVTERNNIIEIDEVPPIPEIHAFMVSLSSMSNYTPIQAALKNVSAYMPNDLFYLLNAKSDRLKYLTRKTTVCSPHSLRASFLESYQTKLNTCKVQGLSSLNATKAAMIKTLASMDYKIYNTAKVSESLKEIVNVTDKKTLDTKVKSLLQSIESTHTGIFVNNIANACARASSNIHFKNIEIKTIQGKLEVIATNKLGQRLITEISTDNKTKIVDTNTEVIGVKDGSCTQIIRSFNDELRKMGVKVVSEKTTSTSQTCDAISSQMMDVLDKKNNQKNKDLQRVRNLNLNQKQKLN